MKLKPGAVVVLMLVGPLALAQAPSKKEGRTKTIPSVSLVNQQKKCHGNRADMFGCTFDVGLDVSFSML